MTIGSILLATALLVAVGIFVTRPFFVLPATPSLVPPSNIPEQEQLFAHKEKLLMAIKELEFDYETGKVPASVYEYQRAAMVEMAADILKQLDELPADADSAIESAIAKRRTKQSIAAKSVAIDQFIEVAIAKKRHKLTQATSPVIDQPSSDALPRFCTQCGQQVDGNDKFCAYCGTPLKKKHE